MTEENVQLTDKELEALKDAQNQNHLTSLVNGGSANVVRHDLVNRNNYLDVDEQVFGNISRKLADNLETGFSGVLNTPSKIKASEIRVLDYATFVRSIDVPSSLTTLSLMPMEGQALLLISSPIIFSSLDRFFGGVGVSTIGFSPNRSFANAESAIVDIITKLVSGALKEAWSPLLEAKFEKRQSENDPTKIQCFKNEEAIVVTQFEVNIGEEIRGEITIAYPHSPVRAQTQKYAKKLEESALISSENLAWSQDLKEACLGLEVELKVELGKIRSSVGGISALKLGDELKLSKLGMLDVTISGVPVFKAISGRAGERLAISIASVNKA